MTAEVVTPVPTYDVVPTLVLVPAASAVLARQQVFVSDCERLLRKAACSGQRLVTALFHILTAHAPVLVESAGQQVYYVCRECRHDDEQSAAGVYPCTTAREAGWALDAVLR